MLYFYIFTIQHNGMPLFGAFSISSIDHFAFIVFLIVQKKKDSLQMMSKQHSDEINSESLMEAFKIFDKVRWRDHLFPLNYIKSQSSFSS